jgi:type II secretion system protein H
MRRRVSPCQRGFTLIELMVVLTLIAIMSAMIIPEMRGTYEDALLRSATRETVCVLDLAASQAAATGQMHRVRMDGVSGRFLIERGSPGGADEYVPVKDLLGNAGIIDPRISVQIVPAETDLADASTPENQPNPADAESPKSEDPSDVPQEGARFFPDGTADARVIILTDRMGIRSLLRVNPSTGRVRRLDPKPE